MEFQKFWGGEKFRRGRESGRGMRRSTNGAGAWQVGFFSVILKMEDFVRPRCHRMAMVKIFDGLFSVCQFVPCNPLVFLRGKPLPQNQILNFISSFPRG